MSLMQKAVFEIAWAGADGISKIANKQKILESYLEIGSAYSSWRAHSFSCRKERIKKREAICLCWMNDVGVFLFYRWMETSFITVIPSEKAVITFSIAMKTGIS